MRSLIALTFSVWSLLGLGGETEFRKAAATSDGKTLVVVSGPENSPGEKTIETAVKSFLSAASGGEFDQRTLWIRADEIPLLAVLSDPRWGAVEAHAPIVFVFHGRRMPLVNGGNAEHVIR